MEVRRVLRMKSGTGETSYARNSSIQRIIASLTKTARQDLATDFYCAHSPETMVIADLGCATGPNALLMVSDAVEAIASKCDELNTCPPEFQIFLNDLPVNDFNGIFRALPEIYQSKNGFCFVSAAPGSFYGRVFPARSLHYVVSSSSLHWLSEVPRILQSGSEVALNKGDIYISKSSPPGVLDAYRMQFQKDFSSFLACRAEEIKEGGLLILTFMARDASSEPSAMEHCYMWELLARALMDMASLGLVEEEKVDSFNAPYYAPSLEEVRQVITIEASFAIRKLQLFQASWDAVEDDHDNPGKTVEEASAERTAKAYRAVVESMLRSHFGEEAMDELFHRYSMLLQEYYCGNKADLTNVLVALQRQ